MQGESVMAGTPYRFLAYDNAALSALLQISLQVKTADKDD